MSQKRILIVDDDRAILDMVKASIRTFFPDYDIALATNGFAALYQLQTGTKPFDILLTTFKMPVMNGLELSRIVRQTWPNTYIIMMSGYAYGDELIRKTNALPLDAFIGKPFSIYQLLETVHPSRLQNLTQPPKRTQV